MRRLRCFGAPPGAARCAGCPGAGWWWWARCAPSSSSASRSFANLVAPYPPDEQNFDLIESPPGARRRSFGTDRFGRDVLSRVIHGSRISLYVAAVSIGASRC